MKKGNITKQLSKILSDEKKVEDEKEMLEEQNLKNTFVSEIPIQQTADQQKSFDDLKQNLILQQSSSQNSNKPKQKQSQQELIFNIDNQDLQIDLILESQLAAQTDLISQKSVGSVESKKQHQISFKDENNQDQTNSKVKQDSANMLKDDESKITAEPCISHHSLEQNEEDPFNVNQQIIKLKKRKNYVINDNGRLINVNIKSIPVLKKHENKVPVFGLPIEIGGNRFKHNMTAKESSDQRWSILATMIVRHANQIMLGKTQEQMYLLRQAQQRKQNRITEGYIKKAMTCGVKIQNHGHSQEFRNKVDDYERIFSKKFKIKKSRDQCSSSPESPTANIRVESSPFNSSQNFHKNIYSFKSQKSQQNKIHSAANVSQDSGIPKYNFENRNSIKSLSDLFDNKIRQQNQCQNQIKLNFDQIIRNSFVQPQQNSNNVSGDQKQSFIRYEQKMSIKQNKQNDQKQNKIQFYEQVYEKQKKALSDLKYKFNRTIFLRKLKLKKDEAKRSKSKDKKFVQFESNSKINYKRNQQQFTQPDSSTSSQKKLSSGQNIRLNSAEYSPESKDLDLDQNFEKKRYIRNNGLIKNEQAQDHSDQKLKYQFKELKIEAPPEIIQDLSFQKFKNTQEVFKNYYQQKTQGKIQQQNGQSSNKKLEVEQNEKVQNLEYEKEEKNGSEQKQFKIESDDFMSRNQTLTQSSFKNSLPANKQIVQQDAQSNDPILYYSQIQQEFSNRNGYGSLKRQYQLQKAYLKSQYPIEAGKENQSERVKTIAHADTQSENIKSQQFRMKSMTARASLNQRIGKNRIGLKIQPLGTNHFNLEDLELNEQSSQKQDQYYLKQTQSQRINPLIRRSKIPSNYFRSPAATSQYAQQFIHGTIQ